MRWIVRLEAESERRWHQWSRENVVTEEVAYESHTSRREDCDFVLREDNDDCILIACSTADYVEEMESDEKLHVATEHSTGAYGNHVLRESDGTIWMGLPVKENVCSKGEMDFRLMHWNNTFDLVALLLVQVIVEVRREQFDHNC